MIRARYVGVLQCPCSSPTAALHVQASEVLFNDSWLFSAPATAERPDILAMIGQPEGEGACLPRLKRGSLVAEQRTSPFPISAPSQCQPLPNLVCAGIDLCADDWCEPADFGAVLAQPLQESCPPTRTHDRARAPIHAHGRPVVLV